MVCNEVKVASCQRFAVVKRAGKHTSCSRLPGLKATVTLERRRVVPRVGAEQEKQGKKMDEEPEGFLTLGDTQPLIYGNVSAAG